jgi:hypothetical protein
MKMKHILCVGVASVTITASAAHAEPTLELMIQEAAGLLHHSCDSLAEVTGGDEEAIISVVEKMVAVSLINREIDIADHATTDEEKEKLRAAFIVELEEGCEADRKALLAGIVDSAVKDVLGL